MPNSAFVTATARPITIPVGDILLQGDLAIPDEPVGLVLFAHGSGSSRASPRNRAVARELHQAHLGTLLFDLLTSEEERSEAVTRHLRFDVGMLADRLGVATDVAGRLPGMERVPIGYFGASTGAAAALIAATKHTPRVRAVVSRGGRADLAGASLELVRAPTLLIVGALDTTVIEMNRQAFRRLHCLKRLEIVPGATHLFEEPGTLELAARLATDWFAHHLRDVPAPLGGSSQAW